MTDAKIATLYDGYKNYGSVRYLPTKVENLRRKATLYGLGTSLGIFFVNELSRFTLRSPLFKLKPVSFLLVAVLPTGFMKYCSSAEIDQEVGKFWRIHKTREEKGLGGTYNKAGLYPEDVMNHKLNKVHHILEISPRTLFQGLVGKPLLDNPGTKLNDGMGEAEHNAFHIDWDKQKVENHFTLSERAGLTSPADGTTAMNWAMRTVEDDDQKLNAGGIDNDSPWHEPADPGYGPQVNHKQDERIIFQYQLTPMNEKIYNNWWNIDPFRAAKDTGMPWWGEKYLTAPDYHNEKSFKEMVAQASQRREFNLLKRKWAMENTPTTLGEKKQEKEEIDNFVKQAYEEKRKDNWLIV